MVGTASIIPARSKVQAEEWSLVLLSQGIESAIDTSEEGYWEVLVDPAQFGDAARTLRLYIAENRRNPPFLSDQGTTLLLFDWGHAWFFALLALIFALSETALPMLLDMGRMDAALFIKGEWWRPLTAVLIHRDVAHLAANVVFGMLLLGLAGGMMGTWPAFFITYASGALANLIGGAVYGSDYRSLGASGMVMAALGLLTSFSLAQLPQLSGKTLAFRGVAGGLLLLVLLGFSPQTDVLAHVSGFVLGLLFGTISLYRSLNRPLCRLALSKPATK